MNNRIPLSEMPGWSTERVDPESSERIRVNVYDPNGQKVGAVVYVRRKHIDGGVVNGWRPVDVPDAWLVDRLDAIREMIARSGKHPLIFEFLMPRNPNEMFADGSLDSHIGGQLTVTGYPGPGNEAVATVVGARYDDGDAWVTVDVPEPSPGDNVITMARAMSIALIDRTASS